jgi:hypothetical protein
MTAALTFVLIALLAAPAVADAASTWNLTKLPPQPLPYGETEEVGLSGISCPTESLCVAVGAFDTVAVSKAPTSGAASWQVVNPSDGKELKGALRAVSCAGPTLCVVVGFEGAIAWSGDPTGGSGAWSLTTINEAHAGATHLNGVSCPSTSLCVAVGGQGSGGTAGKVVTSTEPLSGNWQTTQLDSSLAFTGVSCSSPTLCVAVAKEGRIAVSSDPTGGAAAWRVLGAPAGAGDLEGVGCVVGLCAAGNATGNILTATDPTAPGATWTAAKAGQAALVTGVACPTAGDCVAVDNNGSVFTSTDPSGGPGTWHTENLVPFEASEGEGQFDKNALWSASCPSTAFCALVGANSRIFTSTAPFAATAGQPGGGGRGGRQQARHAPLRPQTFLVFAEHFWGGTVTRHRHRQARFHFYSPTPTKGFECKRDRGPWRRCHSPLRYWVGIGHHILRVRAIGPTGLRGGAAIRRFQVSRSPRDRR